MPKINNVNHVLGDVFEKAQEFFGGAANFFLVGYGKAYDGVVYLFGRDTNSRLARSLTLNQHNMTNRRKANEDGVEDKIKGNRLEDEEGDISVETFGFYLIDPYDIALKSEANCTNE